MSIGLFKSSFLNESKLNEGSGAAKMSKARKNFDAESYIEEKSDETEIVNEIKAICKILGESPKNVFCIDEYADESGAEEIYEKLVDEYYDIIDDNQFSGDSEVAINKKLNVIRTVDLTDQFTMYWFTAKSNF
jgi:spore cortex formation protein SpoVR/YcgB (stage V sporulation)